MPDSPFILEKKLPLKHLTTDLSAMKCDTDISTWVSTAQALALHPSARTQITEVVQLVCWISHLLLPALEWSHWKPPWRGNLPQTNAATNWQWRDFYYYSIITLGSVPKWAYFLPDAISFYPGSSLKVDQWE